MTDADRIASAPRAWAIKLDGTIIERSVRTTEKAAVDLYLRHRDDVLWSEHTILLVPVALVELKPEEVK